MIMNEGHQINLEYLQGSSMHEILTHALKQKKELKLSSLAKDAGFQLLSDDFGVEPVQSLPQHGEDQSNQVLGEQTVEDNLKNEVGIDRNQKPTVGSNEHQEKVSNPFVAEHILLEDERNSLYESSQSYLESEHDHQSMGIAADDTQGKDIVETRISRRDEEFSCSFFFFDGQYRILETLTGGSKMPSVVILDPIFQQHYVLDEHLVLSYSLLSFFLDQFLAGKLPPHQQSAMAFPSPRIAPRPPLVNLDFHETDSIPWVTAHNFAELVLGNISNTISSGGVWNRNVLVLFTNSWCGFCQRMELVVREVYRAIKGYVALKMNSSRNGNCILMGEHFEDVMAKLPLIYMMDCTQNDCSLIIKPMRQKELYPVLLLFPAERKNTTLSYEGDIAVSEIIKFLAPHGSAILDLMLEKNFLKNLNSARRGPLSWNLHHEVLLKDRLQSVAVKYNKINAQFHVGSQERPQLSSGCFLSATEKLMDVHPFDESQILIVQVDQSSGFQGLIVNKHISWDSFEQLEEGFELLKQAPLSFGGPVLRRGMPLVALTQKFVEDQYLQVLPNIYFVDHLATHSLLEEIRVGTQSVHDYWFFLGHSSWGWDQLYHEIAVGAWNVSQGSLEQLEWPTSST